VTCYDGWYVAVAELLDAPLATLDGRLANSPGLRVSAHSMQESTFLNACRRRSRDWGDGAGTAR